MVRENFGSAIMLAALVLNAFGANGCGVESRDGTANAGDQSKRQTERREPAATEPSTRPSPAPVGEENLETKLSGEPKELASGGYSSIKESFIVVARDAETYNRLRRLHDQLPQPEANFFKSNAVIAAYLGQRSSGGYSVQIARDAASGHWRIAEKSPGKDAITTMALTSAFRIVAVAVDEEMPLALDLDATWREAARPYKVSAGEFTRMGGFAGRRLHSKVAGEIRIMRHAELATAFFALEGTNEEGKVALQDVATGAVASEGALTFTRLDPGWFVPPPRYPLRARGQFTEGEAKLSLTLEVMEAKVSDGYGGQGKLEATATAPPKKRAGDDDPM